MEELVGNGWEWSSSPFAPLPGFSAWARTYPGYSADFFDGEHDVVFGASFATDEKLLRQSFRNWYRRNYPYPFTSFRVARRRMIELSDVTKRYGEHVVVDRVSLKVEKGELVVLLGGSGCGKTTTLKMVNRLEEPSSGRILVAGEDISRVVPHELRRRIGYVFQRLGLFPHLTVAENVGVTPRLLGWDEGRIRARV